MNKQTNKHAWSQYLLAEKIKFWLYENRFIVLYQFSEVKPHHLHCLQNCSPRDLHREQYQDRQSLLYTTSKTIKLTTAHKVDNKLQDFVNQHLQQANTAVNKHLVSSRCTFKFFLNISFSTVCQL